MDRAFWRTIKQEYVYLNPTKDVMELRSGIAKLMRYYNYERPHQSLKLLLPARQYGIIVANQDHQRKRSNFN